MNWKPYKKTMLILMAILFLVLVGIGDVFSPIGIAKAKEIGPNEVQGKVLSIYTNAFRRGTIAVKSDQTSKSYTFYVGSRTIYYPHRYPTIGETIRVFYLNDRGYLKATRVEIVESLP